MLAFFFHDFYGFDGAAMGRVMSMAGVCMVIFQMLVTKRLARVIGDRGCIVVGCLMRATACLILVFVFGPAIPLLAPTLNGSGMALIGACSASFAASMAPEEHRGLALGALQSVSSLGNFGGPALGGALYSRDWHLPFLTGGFSLVLGALVTVCAMRIYAQDIPQAPSRETLLQTPEPLQRVSSRTLPKKPTLLERATFGQPALLERVNSDIFSIPPSMSSQFLSPAHSHDEGTFPSMRRSLTR